MIFYVALGSAVGGALRFALGGLVQRLTEGIFPLGTLFVNISGSFLMGFLMRYALASPAISPEVRVLLTTGLCGGYTTFSTFSYETLGMLEDGDYRRAAVYMGLSLVLSLAGMFLGFALAREVLVLRKGV
ncbi:MAG TPA: fluoride efflux transporter CrcB [Gemmatimonadaceae bacterium]|nr:fluoride efflux transporter CrcB [Gemmatimonadaceae bacterium]